MSKRIIAQNEEIVIGVDVSDMKHNVAVVRVRRGEILLDDVIKPAFDPWKKFLEKFTGCDVTVVYEAGPQGYGLYDAVTLMNRKCVVVAPEKHVGVKTDKRDARAIARDYISGSAKEVTVPDFEKRAHRQLLRIRGQFKKDLTRTKNRIRGMLKFHGILNKLTPWRRGTSNANIDFCVAQLEATAMFIEQRIAETDAMLGMVAKNPRYAVGVEKLKKLKGVGIVTALTIMLEVADINAFETEEQFASYTGLCPGERSSGATRKQGRITRQGPGRLRGTLTQAAWAMVRSDAEEKKRFQEMSNKTGKKRAVVAAARRLAVKIWRELKEDQKKAA